MLQIRVQEGNAVIVSGRLDASQAGKAGKVLDTLASSAEIDVSGLEYISSAGIGVLVKTQLRLQATGHTLKLIKLQPRVKAVFHFAGLEEFFGID